MNFSGTAGKTQQQEVDISGTSLEARTDTLIELLPLPKCHVPFGSCSPAHFSRKSMEQEPRPEEERNLAFPVGRK